MKKKLLRIRQLLLSGILVTLTSLVNAQVNVTATGGATSSSYTTLKLAFDAINAGTHTGIIDIGLNANTIETATASLNASGAGLTSYNTISISSQLGGPYTISGAFVGDLITLNGADSVTIRGLTLENTATGASSTVKFINDATANNILNCVIRGASNVITTGTIVFATGTTTGNDYNTISNCLLDSAITGYPANAIYSAGTTTAGSENSNIAIVSNKIANFFNAAVANAGILLNAGSTGWNILNNKLYQAAPRTFTAANNHRGIAVNAGTNYTISNNSIGFSDSNATGFYTMDGAVASTYAGILLNAATTGNNTIASNKIANINFTTSATTATVNGVFAGIVISTGNATVIQNTIGADTGLASIKIVPGSGGALMGIQSASLNNVTILNNSFGALENIGAAAATIASIHCINVSSGAANLTIRGNTIGNGNADNIVAGVLGVTTANTLVSGINQPATAITIIASNNIIRNLSSFGSGTGGYVRGYHTSLSTTATSTAKVDSNTIYNLKTNGTLTAIGSGSATVIGIHYLASLAGGTINNNTIYNLSSLNTGTGAYHVGGIAIGSATNMVISNNKIYDLKNAGTSTTATAPAVVAGVILRSATTSVKVSNNFISLGTGLTSNVAVIGIYGNHGSSPNPIDSILFNTIYISGTVTSGAQPSFGFFRGDFTATVRTITVALIGNIFQNTRTGGTGKHYAISNGYGTAGSSTGWGLGAANYNNLYSANPATVGSWGATDYTLAGWSTVSANDANSISKVISFANTTNADLHLGVASQSDPDLAAPTISAVLFDFDGQIRSSGLTQMGGDEYVTPCVAPPTAGAASAVSSICPNTRFTINISGASNGTGLSFQWQISPSGLPGTFINLPGQTNSKLDTSQTTTNSYRYILTCSSVSDTSTAVSIVTNSTPFAGTYTVNTALPFAGTNYHSLKTLINELTCRGMSAAVTINVAPGTYSGNVLFGNIPGASSINTITVNGNGATITSTESPVVGFNGTSYVTLDSFNIVGASGYAGFGIYVTNQSKYLTINRNIVNVGTTSTATTNAGIAVSGSPTAPTTAGNNAQYLTITNNKVIGGYYSFTLMGNAGYLDNYGHHIANNTFSDFYLYGAYLGNADTVTVSNNDIHRLTRGGLTTFYGIYQTTCRNTKIISNKIHDAGTGSYTAYPIYLTGSDNTLGYETEFINNSIYNINTTGTIYGMYLLGTRDRVNIYHNTIILNNGAGTTRALWLSTAPTNHNIKNNIFSVSGSGAGAKYCIYVTTTAATMVSNNNVLHMGATAGTNNIGYWTANHVTLADWRTASSQDLLSVSSDPVFADLSTGNITPLSINCDNIGAPIAGITTDQAGASRSLTTPDAGALEFTGIPGDIGIISGELKRSSGCYSTNDTLRITIKNVIGTTVDFSINPLKIVWKTTGPVITRDSFMVSSGTLAPAGLQTFLATNVNMSQSGTYALDAYIEPNTVNVNALNDTLASSVLLDVKPILSVVQRNFTVTSPSDTVVLEARSPIFPGGAFIITEVCHNRGTGSPASWPAYHIAVDYIEVTGVPNSDLAGYTLEQWSTTGLVTTYTFPTGTLMSPAGTAIIAVGQLGASVPSPANFYYHGIPTSFTGGFDSGTDPTGRILKNSTGVIIDAVGYSGTAMYTFPAASLVTAADWTGPVASATGTAGIRLTGADLNNATNWVVVSAAATQDPNTLNAGVSTPIPGTLTGFDWNYLGSSFSTSPRVTVGPYTVPGVYTYVASYTNICGTFYDTVRVTATATVPVKLTSFTATKADANVNLVWNTASETNNSHFEIEKSVNGKDFASIGRVKGMGTTNKPSRYAYVDERAANTTATTLYYRLKQVDNNGASTYSRTEVVTLNNKHITGLGTHPNPSNGTFTITADLSSASTVNMKVLNIMGATVWNQTMTAVMGANAFDTQLQLPDGVYMLVVEQDGETSTQKFVIQK